MKKLLALLTAFVMVFALFGCCAEDAEKDTDSNGKNGTLTLEELERFAENKDSGAQTIALFLRKNGNELGKISSPETENAYDFLDSVTLGDYSVSSSDGDDGNSGVYDFRFTVLQSNNDILKQGDYHYTVSGRMWSAKEKCYGGEYDGLVDIINNLGQFKCIAWENGMPAEYGDWFDYGVFQTVLMLSKNSPYVSDDGFIQNEYLQLAARELFGIEDFTPESKIVISGEDTSDIFEYRDGSWGISTPNVALVPMSEITAVRENDGKIEVDVQYYADTCKLIPAQKVTVYVSRTENADFEYFFEKAITVEQTNYGIYFWAC